MTKDEAVVFAPIIKAYSEGKTIQFIGEDGKWHDFTCGDVVFADNPEEYRIKPEAKYRPFKDAQECWEEMQKHQPFGWVKEKSSTSYCLLTAVRCIYIQEGAHGGYFSFCESFNTKKGDDVCPIEHSFEVYTFADGKPFGVEDND